VFINALHDKHLLDCLDRLELADTVDVDLQGIAANEQPTLADVRAHLIELADQKVMQMIQLARASILDDDNPMVSVTRTVDSRGQVKIKRRILGDKVKVLGKLLKLTGGYRDECRTTESCY